MQVDTYNSDDARNRTPPLEAQKINYKVEEPLPPFVRKHPPSPTGEGQNDSDQGSPSGRSRKLAHQPQPQSAMAEAVLISHLAPNRPDIANEVREQPLWSGNGAMPDKPPKDTRTGIAANAQLIPQIDLATKALSLIPETYEENLPIKTDGSPPALLADDKDKYLQPPDGNDPYIKTEPSSPRSSELRYRASIGSGLNHGEDTLKTSPLGKYAIPASSRSAQELLPALQSPPQSISANSPDNPQSLPSLQSALGEQLLEAPSKDHSGRINNCAPHHLPPISGSSPTLNRNVMGHERSLSGPLPPPQMPSPYSHVSPASSKDMTTMSPPTSQPSYWRSTPNIKAEIHFMTSSYESSPHIPQTGNSPATSYPTPTEPKTMNKSERSAYPPAPTQPNGPVPAGSFKCSYPGCTAPPFQTQYLLK